MRLMRNLLLSVLLAAGLILPIGAAQAQSTPTVTATCKDGTAFTGTKRAGACRGHGGVQSWGEATSPANAPSSQPAAQPAPTTTQRATPAPAGARPGVGQYRQQGLPLPRHPLVRQDQAGQLYVRGGSAGTRRSAGPRKGLHLVGSRGDAMHHSG